MVRGKVIMKFKVGDVVRIKEDSQWNDGAEHNPMNVDGKIMIINNSANIQVKWKIDCDRAWYVESDLNPSSQMEFDQWLEKKLCN